MRNSIRLFNPTMYISYTFGAYKWTLCHCSASFVIVFGRDARRLTWRIFDRDVTGDADLVERNEFHFSQNSTEFGIR